MKKKKWFLDAIQKKKKNGQGEAWGDKTDGAGTTLFTWVGGSEDQAETGTKKKRQGEEAISGDLLTEILLRRTNDARIKERKRRNENCFV